MTPESDDARLLLLFKSTAAVVMLLAAFGLVFWLVDGGFWLRFLLAAVMASTANAGITAALDKGQLAKGMAAQRQRLQLLEGRLAALDTEVAQLRAARAADPGHG